MPGLWEENIEYLAAFRHLAGSRPSGFGLAAIPVSEITAYAWPMGYCGGDYETLLDRVRAADNAFLEWCRANPKDASAEPGEDRTDADAGRFGVDLEPPA